MQAEKVVLAKVNSSGNLVYFFFLFSGYFRIFNCYLRTGGDGSSKWEISKQEDGWTARWAGGEKRQEELEENR